MSRAAIFAAVAIAIALPDVSSATEDTADPVASSALTVEWRILGPALSRHYSEHYSPVAETVVASTPCVPGADLGNVPSDVLVQHGLPTTECRLASQGNAPHSTQVLECSAAVSLMFADGARGATVTPCREVTLRRRAVWHQWNPALGVERTVRDGDGVTGVFLGYAQDSYDRPSFMAGVTKRWTLASLGRVRFDAGAMAGLWLRAEMHYDVSGANESPASIYRGPSTIGQLQNGYQVGGWTYTPHVVERVEPVVVPFFFTVEDAASGVGLRIAFAPAFKAFGQVANAVPTLMVQTSYRL